MAHHQAENPAKPSVSKAVFATVSCYGICPVAWFDGATNSIIATPSQWMHSDSLIGSKYGSSLRTDSLAVAMRRLPGVVARIEMEIEHVRAIAGLPVDAMLIRPLKNDARYRSGSRP